MTKRKALILKIFLTLVFLLSACLAFFYFKEQSLKNLPITEELSFRFKAIDKNVIVQKNDHEMWWNNDEGYSLLASSSESIFVAKDFSEQLLEPEAIADKIFKKELDITKTVFAVRGFTLNVNNSSISPEDQRFFDYVKAYEKDNYLCAVTISSEAATYPGSGFGENAKMGYLMYIICSDQLALAEEEQIPFLDALDLKNKEQVARLINFDGDYFHVEIHGRRAGQAAILKKEDGKYRVLLISQEAPYCNLIDKEKIPSAVLSSIGGGDCFSDNGAYVQNLAAPFAYSTANIPVSISKEVRPFNFNANQLRLAAAECGVKNGPEYFNKLVSRFNETVMTVYSFKYQGESQDDGIYQVTIIPNKAGYTSLEQFKKDFDICAVGGDAYPKMLNNDWLLFVSSGGGGVDDGSGRPHGRDEVKNIVEPSLKFN
jgi:hypothetical protein